MKYFIIKIYLFFKYLFQIIILRIKFERNTKIQFHLNKRYLILLPHADDELIGCDQLLKSNNISLLVNMDMSGGDTPEMHRLRYNELKLYSDSCKRTLITLRENKAHHLIDIIKDFKPDFICIPSCFDWHPEHYQVMAYLSEAFSFLGKSKDYILIAMYQVSVPLHPNYINFAVPMTKEAYRNKWGNFVKYYKTQLHLPIRRFRANERINGKLVGAYAAECYIVMTVQEWKKVFEIAFTLDMAVDLKNNINDLVEVRKKVASYYKSCFLNK